MLTSLALITSFASAQPLTNVAGPRYGTTATADTFYDAQHMGDKAVDGSLERGDHCWYSRDHTELPCALTFELPEPEAIGRVIAHQANWHGSMYHTKEFLVQISEDGQTWETVGKGELPDENDTKAEVALAGVRTRWIRLRIVSSYIEFQTCGFAEVELLAAGHPGFGEPEIRLNDRPAPEPTDSHCGLRILTPEDGPQAAVTEGPTSAYFALAAGETAEIRVPVQSIPAGSRFTVTQSALAGIAPTVTLSVGDQQTSELELALDAPVDDGALSLAVAARQDCLVRLGGIALNAKGREYAVPIVPASAPTVAWPIADAPALSTGMAEALLDWDWRLADGIQTEREPRTYAEAAQLTIERGDKLIADLGLAGATAEGWGKLKQRAEAGVDETLWREIHQLRREIALSNPLAEVGPITFIKHVPSVFSHQLTQHYGRYARPGGGVYRLDEPGRSMVATALTEGKLPAGSCRHVEVSHDGTRLLFAFAEADGPPANGVQGHKGRHYHVYEMNADGSDLTQLTDGPYDDFSPRYMPDGRIVFISTRRGGWHRCGSPGCENYVLTVMNADGSEPRPISFHETQEWDPAILNDGRIVYTRWDYVDRFAVLYQQLWSVFPDGSQPSIFYGNTTLNPVGVWEPKSIPGSKRIMATAAAHHAMTAGSVILVDVSDGVDGLEPLTRLTPDVPFPESETTVASHWRLAADIPAYDTPEQRRWPGHCYRSPHPLSETYFIASYSYEGLLGEPHPNRPNMFGIYLCDAFGNRELLYRDVNLGSVWAAPLRVRPVPPTVPSALEEVAGASDGLVVMQDVNDADPALDRPIKALRVVQVLPKSTPGIDQPPVGLPRGAPGKQVLGTVPVEADGSAYLRVPAGVPLTFQALDENGMAVQVMRSLTYLQPGETITCVGCHEPRTYAPPGRSVAALRREPSTIEPGPEGSKPFSFPRLVQPVLDRHCISCHSTDDPQGKVDLTSRPEGPYTASYMALGRRVPFSDQGMIDPTSQPGQFGARGSSVTKLLLDGHHSVELSGEEMERLITWMDANALFYGTFDRADQERQRRGELIAGPMLQ